MGDRICIYRQKNGGFEKAYTYEKKAEFSHSIYGGMLGGRPAVVIGHREGERNLIVFTWNKKAQSFEAQLLDKDCGSANVYKFSEDGEDYIVSTNREIDEAALYKVRL